MIPRTSSRGSIGVETQRRLLTLFAGASLVPVLLLVYVTVAYLLPAARHGAADVNRAAVVSLIVASVILAVAGALLLTATARRISAIAASLADAVPPVPGVEADELFQAETAARIARLPSPVVAKW